MSIQSFMPLGNTVLITANVAAPAPVQAVTYGAQTSSYRVVNGSGNVAAYLGWGSTAAIANANAVVTVTSGSGLPLLPGAVEVLTLSPNAFVTAITAANTAVILVTPGEGS